MVLKKQRLIYLQTPNIDFTGKIFSKQAVTKKQLFS